MPVYKNVQKCSTTTEKHIIKQYDNDDDDDDDIVGRTRCGMQWVKHTE